MQPSPSDNTRQLAFVVEELRMLERRLSDDRLDSSSLRSIATSLSTLLIDGCISVVQPVIGEKFWLQAPNQKEAIEYCLKNDVHTFVAPPSKITSNPTVPAGLIIVNSETKKEVLDRLCRGSDVKWKYHAFLSQEVVVHRGRTACRRDVIQFVRNVLGGAHYSHTPKKPVHIFLRSVASQCRVERPFAIDPTIKMGGRSDVELTQIPVDPHLEIDAVTVELLSIASRVVKSPCTKKLYELLLQSDA